MSPEEGGSKTGKKRIERVEIKFKKKKGTWVSSTHSILGYSRARDHNLSKHMGGEWRTRWSGDCKAFDREDGDGSVSQGLNEGSISFTEDAMEDNERLEHNLGGGGVKGGGRGSYHGGRGREETRQLGRGRGGVTRTQKEHLVATTPFIRECWYPLGL